MFKFAIAAIVSGALAIAAIPQQAQAGGKGLAIGLGVGVGAALLMHSAQKHHARQRAAAKRQAAARRRAAAKKKAAYAAKKKAAYAAKKRAAYAAKKKAAARQAAIETKKRLARQAVVAEAKAEALEAAIELPGKKPESMENQVAETETDDSEEFDTVAHLDEPVELQPVSEETGKAGNLDCKRYVPSAGLTISVPCSQ